MRLLDIMREAGVLWLQITGGEPTMDPDFQGAYPPRSPARRDRVDRRRPGPRRHRGERGMLLRRR
ncbi:hypothetical protein LUR56_11660 [Streptomyces sp. MT29]|nr:hypothetical protein [Streptomyces sp. MT29]